MKLMKNNYRSIVLAVLLLSFFALGIAGGALADSVKGNDALATPTPTPKPTSKPTANPAVTPAPTPSPSPTPVPVQTIENLQSSISARLFSPEARPRPFGIQ